MKYSKPLGDVTSKLLLKYSAEENAARPLASELLSLVNPVSNIEKMAKTRNPLDTEAAHAKKVAQASAKLRASVERTQQRITDLQVNTFNRLNSEIDARSRLAPTADAAEIRAVLRGMDSGERMKAVNRAIKDGNASVLAAVSEGNSLTTGLDDTMRGRFMDSYRRQQAPELFAEMEMVAGLSESIPSVMDMALRAERVNLI